jgi:NAD(P)-dependent dehydrogenase (short-subunit alcohol dehydrogenase family)
LFIINLSSNKLDIENKPNKITFNIFGSKNSRLSIRKNSFNIYNLSKEKRAAYSASKNALDSLTRSIVAEYGKYNILCNTISPGFILTDLTKKNNTEEELKIIAKNIPVGRLGTPEEIADLVYNLTINNNYLVGQNIIIDGGFTCIP